MADVDMGELARYAARSVVPPDVAVDVQVEEGVPHVRGHHDALARALSNVLLNAVDACATSGDRRIGVMVARAGDNGTSSVTVAVRDSGVGIPPDRLATIWEPYVTHKPGGTGLGLAITRQTILAHAGTVSATSEPGRGTQITFTLPASPAEPDAGRTA